jgi:hypothetical protein
MKIDFCRYDKTRDYQEWKYDIVTKQMISLYQDKWCLTAANDKSLYLNECNSSDLAQKWAWTHINQTALNMFDAFHWDWDENRVVGLN